MKKEYIVGGNGFRVELEDGMKAWERIERDFRPFEVEAGLENAVVEIGVRIGAVPEYEAERIYEPEYEGIGFICAHALQGSDGSIIMEFEHVEEKGVRLWMRMPAEPARAEIVITDGDRDDDSHLLKHALMLAFMIATAGNGTLMMHSSTVVRDGKAYLFQGRSGTGKSTHAKMWMRHVEGVELLNDDHPVVRFAADGTAMAYGSPWSGKTACYRNVSAPIGAFVRIVRAQENELKRLSPLMGYASLTTSVFFLPFLSERLRERRHQTIERLASTVGCYEMHCRPDADAAITCVNGLRSAEGKE